ncbi:MAG: hypothetical protein WCA19_00075 [Candidatus Acidiferrales bacterium]
MKTAKVLQVKTVDAATHVVIRNAAGRKLFDMTMPGLTLVVTVSADAEIKVDPRTP